MGARRGMCVRKRPASSSVRGGERGGRETRRTRSDGEGRTDRARERRRPNKPLAGRGLLLPIVRMRVVMLLINYSQIPCAAVRSRALSSSASILSILVFLRAVARECTHASPLRVGKDQATELSGPASESTGTRPASSQHELTLLSTRGRSRDGRVPLSHRATRRRE